MTPEEQPAAIDTGSIRVLSAEVRKSVSALLHKVEEVEKKERDESRHKEDSVYETKAYNKLRAKYWEAKHTMWDLQADNKTLLAALQELGKDDIVKLAAKRLIPLKNFENDRDSWREKCRELKSTVVEQSRKIDWLNEALAERDATINKMKAAKTPWLAFPPWPPTTETV